MMMTSFSLQNDISCALHGWWGGGGGRGIRTEANYEIASETPESFEKLLAEEAE